MPNITNVMEYNIYNFIFYNHSHSCAYFTQEMLNDPALKSPIFGICIILLSLIFFILDLICLSALLNKKIRTFNGIRIMIAISMCDVSNIIPIGIIPGIMMVKGHIYCSNVVLSYFHGQSAVTLYTMTCSYTVLLSINRCLGIAYPRLEAKLFDGMKVFMWIAVISAFYFYFFFTAPIDLFSSVIGNFVYNPYIRYEFIDDGIYDSTWHNYNNLLTAIFVVVTYLAFAAFYLHVRNQTNKMSFSGDRADCTKSVFASVFINASTLCFSNIFYLIIKDIEVGDIYYRVSLAIPILVQGMNAMLYYILNPTIRGIVQSFRIYKVFKFDQIGPVVEAPLVVTKNTIIT
uniref:G_PROTEIN_RECEP_F1_2 domain-containing protein n=1 Tax=Rhabditophanes sp. KR3021 TaxID=114890 RepID=A0AC35U6V3_9BILA